ncbi:MAG: hypothetical protein K8R40_13130, partial [Anaerolineaceae bacterium]|nr:hypothetical protein [Anaerolineaceae bacterium]
GTKHMGEFFVLAIPIYLLWGVVKRKIDWQKAVLLAMAFVVVMLAFVVISNPLLLLPQERNEIIAVQKQQFFETTQGSLVANASFDLDSVRQNLGQLWFIALALIGMGLGIYREETRLRTVLILSWLLPLSYVILFASPQRAHYYINLGLPLYLCLDNFFNQKEDRIRITDRKFEYRKLAQWGVGLLILIQFVIFLRTDISVYRGGLNREENSQALQFYDRLESEVFSQLSDDAEDTLLVYRDWKIYCPPETGRQVVMNWGFATEEYIQELDPDILLLETSNINLFSASVSELVGVDSPYQLQQFYSAADEGLIEGYHLLIKDDFTYVFVSELIYQTVFQ